jgi:hypothetical protein
MLATVCGWLEERVILGAKICSEAARKTAIADAVIRDSDRP